MSSFKDRIKKAHQRIRLALDVLLCREEHWFFVSLTENELVKLIKEEEFETRIIYCGLQGYNVKQIIQQLSNGIDPDEMILQKAEFEAKALYNLMEE